MSFAAFIRVRALPVALLLWLGTTAAAAEIGVEITAPAADEAIFDRVEIAARVFASEAVERVEFLLDGRLIGTLAEPPYRLAVDVGPDNRERFIEVRAYGRDGSVSRAQRTAPAVLIHERVELDLQQLYATVTDRHGRRMLELGRQSFNIRDDGQRQELVTFARGDIPFTAVLLIDGSLSMRGEPLRAAIRGAHRFVAGMRSFDEAKLLVHSDRPLMITPWSADPGPLARALDDTQASGGTAALDHLFMALTLLEARHGRRVVVMLSDGFDLHSVLAPEQLRRAARRSQAMIYWVRQETSVSVSRQPPTGSAWVTGEPQVLLRPIPLSTWRDAETSRHIHEALEAVVRESGGRVVPIAGPDEIEGAFGDILAELREQYALGYYPDPRRNDGAWRKLEVQLSRRGLKVRTREGYVDRF